MGVEMAVNRTITVMDTFSTQVERKNSQTNPEYSGLEATGLPIRLLHSRSVTEKATAGRV